MTEETSMDFSRNWKRLADLFDPTGAPVETARALLPDYREEIRLAASLRAHAALMPYPFMRTRMETLAEQTAAHATTIAELIRREGGAALTLPGEPEITRFNRLIRNLEDDTSAVKSRILRYRELVHGAPPHFADAIRVIHDEKIAHETALLSLAVRIVQ